jgi:hypothetical protein
MAGLMNRATSTHFISIALFAILSTQGTSVAQSRSADPTAIVANAIEAMGGETVLTSLRSLELDVVGHEWATEQSERPEGPWLAQYMQRIEVRDLPNRRLRYSMQGRDWNAAMWSPQPPLITIVAGDVAARTNGQRWMPGSPNDVKDAAEIFSLAPERLLLTAKNAPDLTTAKSRRLHGVDQDAVAFTSNGQRLTLFLNRWTHMPTMLEMVRDDPWGIWGDMTERRWYSFWALQQGGLWYPRQVNVDWNGQPRRESTVMAMMVNPDIDEQAFTIPDEQKTAYATLAARPSGFQSLRVDASRAVTISDSVIQLAGAWNAVLVKQPDGIVILEAPISSTYTEGVLADVQSRFPGMSVKAVVTTSDAWPHIGGVREYVARKIPIYALDLNLPILERLVKAPRTFSPDALSRKPAAPQWRTVAARTVIGTGDTRVELLPVRGEVGERMMIAWLPGLRLLYASDLLQRSRDGKSFFMPGMLAETIAAVEREQIGAPDRAIAMHLAPTPWTEVVAAVASVRGR